MKGFGLYLIIILLLLAAVSYMLSMGAKSQEINYSDVVSLFEQEQVSEFEYNDGTLTMRLQDQSMVTAKVPYLSIFVDDLGELIRAQREEGILKNYTYKTVEMPWWANFVPYLVVLVLFGLLWYFMMNKQGGGSGNPMQFGRARARLASDDKNKVTFADVAGADEEKAELQEIVEFLKNPQKFIQIGARIPKGVLLVGPPGTGKTLIAKAVAGEAGVPFLSISGSDFVELYVGVGASRVRDLFEQAKKNAPAIVFIDEIDAVGRQRGAGLGGGHDEREQTLNQLLVEMDGFGANEGVIVIAATNRKDILDHALLRPGRFDRQVYVGEPDVIGREAILKVHARGKQFDPDVNFKSIAQTTAGFTGADLENLLNEAALLTGRQDKKLITEEAIHQSVIKVIAGPEKHSRVVPEAERRLTAFHEAGHAVVMHALPRLDPVHQITIVPRGQAGGMTIYLPEEDRSYLSRSYMLDQVAGLLGGRVAEEMMLGDISTGASSDIQRATAIARKMVGTYGMSAKMGSVAFDAGADEVFIGKSMGHTRPYSEETAAEMDAEIRAIIDAAYQQCREILARYKSQLTAVAEYLLENETMDAETFETYFADSGENGESRV